MKPMFMDKVSAKEGYFVGASQYSLQKVSDYSIIMVIYITLNEKMNTKLRKR